MLLMGLILSIKSKILEELARPVVEGLGYEFWGIEYISNGKLGTLRLYIDTEKGVYITDCEKVSRQLSGVLDVEDPLSEEYTLEVSSPGLDRPFFYLDQYARFVNEEIQLKLRMPFEGRRKFKGILRGIENNEVIVQVENEEYLFPFESIEKANMLGKIK
jgi:ribosome maturation factor RimP